MLNLVCVKHNEIVVYSCSCNMQKVREGQQVWSGLWSVSWPWNQPGRPVQAVIVANHNELGVYSCPCDTQEVSERQQVHERVIVAVHTMLVADCALQTPSGFKTDTEAERRDA